MFSLGREADIEETRALTIFVKDGGVDREIKGTAYVHCVQFSNRVSSRSLAGSGEDFVHSRE